MDSADASAIYLTAFSRVGKDSNKPILEVPASKYPFNWSTQHSRFLATTVDVIAGFRFDRVESNAFFRRESALLSMASLRITMFSNARSVHLETCKKVASIFGFLFQTKDSSSSK